MLSLLRRFRNRRFARDLEQELEFHRDMAERALGDEDAARRAMGNETLMREESRAVWIAPWLESVWQDLRYALRSLRQAPGFTLAAVGALAVAIGVNTSYFTVFNAIAIRPWPVPDPGRIVTVFSSSGSGRPGGLPVAEYRYLRDHAKTLQGAVAYRQTSVLFGFESGGKVSPAQHVSANFFDVLGVGMAAGRGFLKDEDRPEAPSSVAVLSFETWRSRFGADPAIVGRIVRIDNLPFVVVGVTAQEFTGVIAGQTSVYVPLAAMRLLPREKTHALAFLTNGGNCCSSMAARLAPGVSRADADAELDVLSRQFREAAGLEKRDIQLGGTQFFFTPGAKGEMRAGFGLLYLGVTLLLLLACANVGNLCLARAAARSREFAIRGSLGAGRSRLIRQLLTEGLTVAALALVPGVALAYWLPRALIMRMTEDAPSIRLEPDSMVLLYAVLLGGVSTLLFALTPALSHTRDFHSSLKSGGAGAGGRFRLRMVLLGVQTATSVVLLVAAGLMTRGVQRVATVDPGFSVNDVAAIELDLPAEMYAAERVKPLAAALAREIAPLPHAALSLNSPLSNVRHSTGVSLPGQKADGARMDMAQLFEASPRYFEVLRIPVLQGRVFTEADMQAGKTVVINESMARRYWPHESAVGKTIEIGTPYEVIGVVRDAQMSSLGTVAPAYYRAVRGDFVPTILVRQNPLAIEAAKAAAQRAAPEAELRVVPLRVRFDRQVRPVQFGAAIAGALSLFGLVLASMGVFGVCAFVVQQRRREIGIRIACGARPAQVASFVLGANGRAVGIGLIAGGLAAVVVSNLLEGNLYGVSPLDPPTYAVVFLLLATAGAVATAVPAWRAARTDPVAALRAD